MTYLLASWQPGWVQFSQLEPAEKRLDGRSRVAVRGRPDYSDLQLVEEGANLNSCMIAGSIEQQVGVSLPPRLLFIELRREVLEEDQHDLLVGVGVREREPDPALSVHGSNERDPRRHGLPRDS